MYLISKTGFLFLNIYICFFFFEDFYYYIDSSVFLIITNLTHYYSR